MKSQRDYVVLLFDPDPDVAIKILVVRNGPSLEVSLPANWQEQLSGGDREYVSELVNDWRSANADSIPLLLRELSQLAVGPLRTIESNLLDNHSTT